MFVLVPVTTRASHAAVLLESGTGKAKDGVLFGLYLTFTLAAIYAAASALDAWEGWVVVAVMVTILTVQWLRKRHA
jgi:hypothetical protein